MLLIILFHGLREVNEKLDVQKLDSCVDGYPDCVWSITDVDYLMLGVYTTVEFEPIAEQDKLAFIRRLQDCFRGEFEVTENWAGEV